MMHGREKSDSAIVADEADEQSGAIRCGAGGAKGGGQGECGPAKHAPDAEPGKRVTGAGARTASSKAKEEGEVHRALPPSSASTMLERRSSNSSGDAAAGVDGLTWRDYEADLERKLEDLHARVHRGAYRALPSRRRSTSRSRTADSARSRLLRWRTRSSSGRRSAVLNAIYEEDFLGFSYGFRPGRGPHDALDALVVGIEQHGR